jgi:hypothetical protein
MRIDDSTKQMIETVQKANGYTPVEDAKVQVTLLKNALDAQKQQAAQILQMMEGKGSVIDITA